ncbi:helix-turn-helix domain-containing protein [Alkalibacter rhizosphaerae]|uniref:Helix-turn-helix domain-containing protein n=1 Tax=Alkalibacter rhizosphaerae TaxID=2815577 RepID=A0A975AI68_9FIRM|nr:helix-turn-helix domain-containing protein [Alkalibacter rhizosphaerae]QSX09157.1 helix-turn-helix domain-containing protein [Alkalibacter rhizosphaerae]
MSVQENHLPKLKITMQTLADRLSEYGLENILFRKKSFVDLVGFRLYDGYGEQQEDLVYLCTSDQLLEAWMRGFETLVVVGRDLPEAVKNKGSLLVIQESYSLAEAANGLQKIFSTYLTLERKINQILYNDGKVEDLSQVLLDHFGNPLFIHDEYFNILACPKWVEGMSMFTYNQQTGKFMQDMDSINYFRTSDEYKETLVTRGGHEWLSGLTDFRTIYANIWNDGRFRGRIVVNELTKVIKESQLNELGYFAELASLLMIRRDRIHSRGEHPFNNMVMDMLSGNKMEVEALQTAIATLGWEVHHQYICGLFSFAEEEVTKMSIYGICNGIEHQVPGSYSFYHDNKIYMIVNMTVGQIDKYDLRKHLSTIIREGILYVGLSNPFCDIFDAEVYFKQARVALEFGQNGDFTSWYHEFKDHALAYWLHHGMGEFSKKTLADPALFTLKEYDRIHHSSLFETLKVYLKQERNATLTSQLLQIHRSTLPYRLEKIIKMTGIDLEQADIRLFLIMSYRLLEGSS